MKKRIFSILLCVLLTVPLMAGCTKDAENVLTVGVETINTDMYPFTAEGDETIKNIIYTHLLDFDENGKPFVGGESSAVTESFRVYFADGEMTETESYAEGGYTAFEFTLKNGIFFSDGSSLTAEDVMFSLYCALDPKAGYVSADTLPVAGLDNYIYQSADAEEYLKIASEILSKGTAYVPTEEDTFTENESSIYWGAFYKAGEDFVSNIVSYVSEEYCTDDLVSSYIIEGYKGEDVKNSEALSASLAMRLWNYGNYTYSYVPDENGIYVGVVDENGGYSYKTTLEKALESDEYTVYVQDDEGKFVFDKITAKYVPFEEGSTEKRYSRVLSDKYTVISKSALTGFRDMAGKLYTLEGEDYPTSADFFSLMCISYTTDGIIDYKRMESVEAAKEGDSFTKAAAEAFASALAGTHSVDTVKGIVLDTNENLQKVTVYVEGNVWDKIYLFDIPIVSKTYCLEGFEADGEGAQSYGVPLASDAFSEHLRARFENPVGAGAFVLEEISENSAVLASNKNFNAVSPEFIPEARYGSIEFVPVSKNNSADICLASAEEGTLSENAVSYFTPGFAYDYAVINPAHYININTRRALISVMDTSIAAGGDEKRRMSSSMPSFMWASSEGEGGLLYDESGETAKAYFEAAGYTISENGELIDPATKQKAAFKFSLLPSAEGGAVCGMFTKAAEILNSLGANAEIVYDADLLINIYSDTGVGIYSLGWETDAVGSLYMRYGAGSGSEPVKANGISALLEGGQIDNFGTVTFTDGEGNSIEYNQSSAVSVLEALIVQGDESIVLEDKKVSYGKALSLISELSFEVPLCQRGETVYVNSAAVDVSTVNETPTAFASVISRPWQICPVITE
ncbi:MAG: hypothetical protein E7660_07265 [Ruminococcaceae bacterium]|nr:hypothetical protein [Oscillospiraceae bacterium]